MLKLSKFIFFFSGLLFLFPFKTFAHVRWFAHPDGFVRPYSITDTPVIIWLLISIIAVILGVYLEKKLKIPKQLSSRLPQIVPTVHALAQIGFGLSLIIFSIKGFIFAPNFNVSGSLTTFLLWFQAIAGLMLIFGFYPKKAGAVLLTIFIIAIKEYGIVSLLDALEFIGIALYLLFITRTKFIIFESTKLKKVLENLESYSVPLLRIGVGLNLFILGFSEKILNPALAQNFLTEYSWNFMRNLGFENFTDYWFIFSAGAAESLIGLFLILGILTRLTTLALAGFLVTTLILLGPIELIGHLPHFSAAIIFLTIGSGDKLKMVK